MHNLSEEELDALGFNNEVTTSDWIRLNRKLFVRTFLAIMLTLIRVAAIIFNPQGYSTIVYPTIDISADNLVSLAYGRLFFACIFFSVYLLALRNNFYLRSISMAAVVIAAALFWSDLQMYFIGGFSQFTAGAFAYLILRLCLIYLILANYIDIRR